MHPKKRTFPKAYGFYTGLSIQMFAIMAISAWAGMRLDQYFELSFPWFLLSFAVSATVLSIYWTITKLIQHIDDKTGNTKNPVE